MEPELRKQELMEIAFRQFLQKGYEKTSIRSILGEANGEIGMFYHHFASKEEIFNAMLEQYNIEYIKRIEQIVSEKMGLPFLDLLEYILLDLESSLAEYANMNQGAANREVLMLLHQNTLISLRPIFSRLIRAYIGRGEISPPETDMDFLADFLLFGVSGVVHDNREKGMEGKKESIKVLLSRLLGITQRP